MGGEVATTTQGPGYLAQYGREEIELIKKTVAKGATDEELGLFFHECKRRGVHPLDRLIHFVKRNDGEGGKVVAFQSSIDYHRAKAETSKLYNGQDEPEYEGEETVTEPMGQSKTTYTHPLVARVKVYKRGIDKPFIGTARWSEYYPKGKQGFMWRKMPFLMLAKCAEALALRKAFPDDLGGLYTPEELQRDTATDEESGPSLSASVESTDERPPEESGAKKPDIVLEPPKEVLKREVEAFVDGDKEQGLNIIREVLQVKAFSGYDKLSEEKAKTGLSRLISMMVERDGQPQDCGLDPLKCSMSAYEEGRAVCTAQGSGSDKCYYGIGRIYNG